MKYFTMKEFECRCWCGMPEAVKTNIEALVSNVLDPVRGKFGKPIKVNSGYRCEKHNAEVGGARRSQHMVGEAADIAAQSREYSNMRDWKHANLEIAKLIVQNGRFDQLILESTGVNDLLPCWIHVSWKAHGPNRGQVLKKVAGQKGYLPVSVESLELGAAA